MYLVYDSTHFDANKKTIIAAENDLENFDLLTSFLYDSFNVIPVRNRDEILECCNNITPDLMFVDTDLEGLADVSECKMLFEKYNEFPIIGLYNEVASKNVVEELGKTCSACLKKSLGIKGLLEAVEEHI